MIVDPLGSAGAYIGMTDSLDDRKRYKIAIKACIIAAMILIISASIGILALNLIKEHVIFLYFASGILIAVTACKLLIYSDKDKFININKIAYYPLCIPLLAGPACIISAILLISETSTLGEKLTVMCAIVLSEVSALIAMVMMVRFRRYIKYVSSAHLRIFSATILFGIAFHMFTKSI
tara:strand:- start:2108 stop:2644 length:537 start_codon:yes stop_codon:yes gene_type:complete